MMFGLFRRSANKALIERLYLAIVAASRAPALYRDYGVPDTFEGRFESLTLHAVLILRRLRDSAAPGPEMAQDLVDVVFQHFDRTLREMGVGDTVVPKRMKKMAEAFLGRSTAYDEALRAGPAALVESLSRNVYNGRGDARALAHYVEASLERIGAVPLQTFVDGTVPFADPAATLAPASISPASVSQAS